MPNRPCVWKRSDYVVFRSAPFQLHLLCQQLLSPPMCRRLTGLRRICIRVFRNGSVLSCNFRKAPPLHRMSASWRQSRTYVDAANGPVRMVDRFYAACSWSLAGAAEDAFRHLKLLAANEFAFNATRNDMGGSQSFLIWFEDESYCWEVFLCSDGALRFRDDSVTAFGDLAAYSALQGGVAGRWQVLTEGNRASFASQFEEQPGRYSEMNIDKAQSATYLSGKRFQITWNDNHVGR